MARQREQQQEPRTVPAKPNRQRLRQQEPEREREMARQREQQRKPRAVPAKPTRKLEPKQERERAQERRPLSAPQSKTLLRGRVRSQASGCAARSQQQCAPARRLGC